MGLNHRMIRVSMIFADVPKENLTKKRRRAGVGSLRITRPISSRRQIVYSSSRKNRLHSGRPRTPSRNAQSSKLFWWKLYYYKRSRKKQIENQMTRRNCKQVPFGSKRVAPQAGSAIKSNKLYIQQYNYLHAAAHADIFARNNNYASS